MVLPAGRRKPMPEGYQERMFIPKGKQLKIKPDEFAQNCRPLEELLDMADRMSRSSSRGRQF